MKLTHGFAVVSLIAVFGINAAFADPKVGEPCERSGDQEQVDGGVGSKVFTCLGDKWSHTNTVGEKQFSITAELSDGQVFTFVTKSGQVARISETIEQLYVELGTGADGKDVPASAPYNTGMMMAMTPTLSQSGDIALKIRASMSKAASIDEYEFGDNKVQSPEVRSYGLSRTVKLRQGKPEVISFGPLTMKLTVVGI